MTNFLLERLQDVKELFYVLSEHDTALFTLLAIGVIVLLIAHVIRNFLRVIFGKHIGVAAGYLQLMLALGCTSVILFLYDLGLLDHVQLWTCYYSMWLVISNIVLNLRLPAFLHSTQTLDFEYDWMRKRHVLCRTWYLRLRRISILMIVLLFCSGSFEGALPEMGITVSGKYLFAALLLGTAFSVGFLCLFAMAALNAYNSIGGYHGISSKEAYTAWRRALRPHAYVSVEATYK